MSGHSKWANIKHKKGKMDAVRGKVTTKISREITIAVRMGGSDPTGNMRLKLALQKARENNIPKENIQRAIQKGSGTLEGSNYEEIKYEGYGPGGVAIIVEAMTDNRNRTAADVRHLFSKYGGNLGETGCVSWMFKQKGVFAVEQEGIEEEKLMLMVLDAGAEDFEAVDDQFEITTDPEDFEQVQEELDKNNIKTIVARVTMVPETISSLSGDEAVKMMKLLEALEDHDDIQEVYTNFDIPEDMEE
ncbi:MULTISPECIES: YebC/PmpR family DNA-binding transcriptional regulator [Sporomusa]|jgi:YebC/PmpR family DNA-binding regulatory protein|uniref:YebC/PmpR family DNA-binding transcriptional regulator n=1 Tax=Sporomusa TaxID=2375 RepID=UPI001665C059|nr:MULTISPECIES: YebC/PmpR family DNA-binding transcriptional regulator [Sporomusa]MCM0757275.1 YebC/PmpR family DNA-binding transcriptional regulator [Sporomusa sphaeroides DSM 2875]HML34266.1 YebC/PmpR family DNA-binding transcriptional regulator [Sporomusa sphaeroides]